MLSLALHLVVLIALLLMDVPSPRTLPFPQAQALILVTPVFRPRMPPPARLPRTAVRARMPELVEAPMASPRVFVAPSVQVAPRAPVAVLELPSTAVDTPVNPSQLATSAHLPVLPAPPLKTDNLASVASAPAAPGTGRMEAAGFGAAAVARASSARASPSTTGGFAAATLEKAALPDSTPPSRAGFGDASVGALAAPRTPSGAPQDTSATPVEILEKPRPLYTEEARRLRLEGEVLIETRFPAAGPAKTLRVLRGLGHGLDESAIAAVQSIRFRPAKRAGQAIDSNAIVHVAFQIAY